jgi:hypothetical protein
MNKSGVKAFVLFLAKGDHRQTLADQRGYHRKFFKNQKVPQTTPNFLKLSENG